MLCVNVGSSSLKFAVYELGEDEERLDLDGEVVGVGRPSGRLWLRCSGEARESAGRFPGVTEAVAAGLEAIGEESLSRVHAVGHRVVHGGACAVPRRVDEALLAELGRLVPLAPLHQRGALEVIHTVGRHLPRTPQVACFDSAFHQRLPELARHLPLPQWAWDEGVRRYGFHGLSFESVVWQLGAELAPRTVIAHLGSGASLVALADGHPVDTTMSFTPSGGVMMGTRSGDLDPGILIYLLREKNWDADRLERLVNSEAGLLGVSGRTSDMRELLEVRERDRLADAAVSMFCRDVRRAVGGLTAILGGLDLLVFTGAIGEHSGTIRNEICEGLDHLGIRVGSGGRPRRRRGTAVRVVAQNENLMIARHTRSAIADS